MTLKQLGFVKMTNYLRCQNTIANDKPEPRKNKSAQIMIGLKVTFYIPCTSNIYPKLAKAVADWFSAHNFCFKLIKN